MIRLVAALLLVFLGTVHTWAGGDDGLFARPLFSSEYVVVGHDDHGVPMHAPPARAQALLALVADNCCPDAPLELVSFISNCMMATMADFSCAIAVSSPLSRPAIITESRRSSLDDTGNIFRPPII